MTRIFFIGILLSLFIWPVPSTHGASDSTAVLTLQITQKDSVGRGVGGRKINQRSLKKAGFQNLWVGPRRQVMDQWRYVRRGRKWNPRRQSLSGIGGKTTFYRNIDSLGLLEISSKAPSYWIGNQSHRLFDSWNDFSRKEHQFWGFGGPYSTTEWAQVLFARYLFESQTKPQAPSSLGFWWQSVNSISMPSHGGWNLLLYQAFAHPGKGYIFAPQQKKTWNWLQTETYASLTAQLDKMASLGREKRPIAQIVYFPDANVESNELDVLLLGTAIPMLKSMGFEVWYSSPEDLPHRRADLLYVIYPGGIEKPTELSKEWSRAIQDPQRTVILQSWKGFPFRAPFIGIRKAFGLPTQQPLNSKIWNPIPQKLKYQHQEFYFAQRNFQTWQRPFWGIPLKKSMKPSEETVLLAGKFEQDQVWALQKQGKKIFLNGNLLDFELSYVLHRALIKKQAFSKDLLEPFYIAPYGLHQRGKISAFLALDTIVFDLSRVTNRQTTYLFRRNPKTGETIYRTLLPEEKGLASNRAL